MTTVPATETLASARDPVWARDSRTALDTPTKAIDGFTLAHGSAVHAAIAARRTPRSIPKACPRAAAVDLRDDWPTAPIKAGFDRRRPTAWRRSGLGLDVRVATLTYAPSHRGHVRQWLAEHGRRVDAATCEEEMTRQEQR